MYRAAYAAHVMLYLLLIAAGDLIAAPCDPPTARLISVQGGVELQRAGITRWQPAALAEVICAGDALRVLGYGRAALQLPDATVLRLDQNTTVTFPPARGEKRTWLEMLEGLIHIISRDPRSLRITTPFANAGIDGTEFLVEVRLTAPRGDSARFPLLMAGTDDRATITVLEGRVTVSNANATESASIAGGQRVIARPGQPLVIEQVVRPLDAVQWTLYYPAVSGAAQPVAASATVPAGQVADAGFFVNRARSRLAVGRVAEASADLDAALRAEPDDAEALALQAIIAVTRNDRDGAMSLAERAVASDPRSASALIARSYAAQAAFDLPAARASLEAAVAANARDALAYARLAEIALADGDLDAALLAAKRASELDPGLALTQTVLGFANLARIDLGAARNAFQRAVELDSAAALPRLGLGLATIREGDLQPGREQIELAVMLDPSNSLIRSYMGKAYYEEKRDKLAATQYDIAKALDPQDPTPWFYDAIREQTRNRPVQALKNLQQSVHLNDNRAVYRSRLSLDTDLAARSASVGRVYGDLGFPELALRQGWQSVNDQPADFSGHRLLADSYASVPRYEVARVNELLQSQLLQPLNVTPIPPQFGEANIFVLDTAGPTQLAFNEFNPLFNRDQLRVQGSAVAGGNDTRGEDVAVAGVSGRWSFSVGQFHFETDGYRVNNDLEQDVLNALVQFQPTADTSLLAEVRSSERDQGDLTLLFDPTFILTDLHQSEDTESLRLGVRHAFSARSTLLGLGTVQEADAVANLGSIFGDDSTTDIYTAELQHLYRGRHWGLTTGLRYTDRGVDRVTTFAIPLPDPPFLFESVESSSTSADVFAAYAYGRFDVSEQVSLTAGASVDLLDDPTVDSDTVNPKLGLAWQPADGTVIRAGIISTVQVPTFSRQDIPPSLEPTQVAGFNQFFAGIAGQDAWRYGFGADQRLSRDLAIGIELSRRDVETPYQFIPDVPDPIVTSAIADSEERNARAYLYWTPRQDFALSTGYQFDRFDDDPDFEIRGFLRMKTHRVPLDVRWLHRRGLAASVTTTYVNQRGVFRDQTVPFVLYFRDDDQFIVMDASLSYRLPKRWGLLRFEVRNLLDRNFRFQDIDPENPRIVAERLALLKLTVAY
jgi:tetratricopeptide (TPR) repeat protein